MPNDTPSWWGLWAATLYNLFAALLPPVFGGVWVFSIMDGQYDRATAFGVGAILTTMWNNMRDERMEKGNSDD